MSDLLTRLRDWLRNPASLDSGVPDFAAARALGIPEVIIESFWRTAVVASTPEFEATRIFDDMVAIWEYGRLDDLGTEDTAQ